MNRREFIKGTLTTVVAVAAPETAVERVLAATPAVGFEAWWEQWVEDISKVMVGYQSDLMIYGTAAIEFIDEYPFVKNVYLASMYTRLGDCQ